jgi:hypothetical protein
MASTRARARALLHAGTAHKELHVSFPINLAYAFKAHLDIFIFIKMCSGHGFLFLF